MITLKIYSPANKKEWDSFISSSRNGTFLFARDYMDYHSDRFSDFSILAYHNNKLVAVLPANRKGQILYSHQGLTYGGWVTSKAVDAVIMLSIFEEIGRTHV